MVHVSAKLAVLALAAAPALASAVAYDVLEYDARDYDDMTDIEARKINIGGLKTAAKFAGKWFNRLSTGATVLSLGGAVAGAASQQPRSLDAFEDSFDARAFEEELAELEARGKQGKRGRRGRKGGKRGRKGRKGGKRGRKAKKAKAAAAAAAEATPDAGATPEAAVPDEAAAQAPVEGRMVKRRLSARDFMLDEELEAFEAREEFFGNLDLD